MPDRAPPDDAERQRITAELDATLFVEAGAGSGKTWSLVERIHALVVVAGVPMREIAAITFTDKAAAELRDRVRRRFEDSAAGPDPAAGERARDALLELDGAAVCTLHAFAQRLLTDHPLAAGLPPRVEVADEVASQLAFDERWAAFVDVLLDDERLLAEPDDEEALALLLDEVRRLEVLRDVALAFDQSWDLVAEQVAGRAAPPVPRLQLGGLLPELIDLAGLAEQALGEDTLTRILDRLADQARALANAATTRDQLRVLDAISRTNAGGKGNKPNWARSAYGNDLDPLRRRVNDLAARCAELRLEAVEACLRRVAIRLGDATVAAAELRRADGRLAFHDLLVLARELLRDPERGPAARDALHRRYTRLLLDEFQDTDPIQVEIATLLTAPPSVPAGPWASLTPEPGRLFLVGDPKQSIYRFRRADIATFLAAREAFTDRPVALTANFRTAAPVVAWVNALFAQLIIYEPGAQPEFQHLEAVRSEALAGPAVLLVGEEHAGKVYASELRAFEVADVVDAVRAAVGAWEVVDAHTGELRVAVHGDVAILIPSRTVLDALEDELDEANVPYRTESSSLAYASREVRSLLLALKAVDDPSDELALVSTLRSALFGCSDPELFRWVNGRGGRWSVLPGELPAPEGPDDPVHAGVAYLQALAAGRHWATPAELLDQLIRDRRALEVAGHGRRARDVWRRLRYLVDQARVWREAGGGTLRDYLSWAYRQATDSVRVTEAVLPETDHDAVRIMTVHAAKGLEFPIVMVAGLTTQPQGARRGVDVIWSPSGPQFRLATNIVTKDYEVARALDDQLDDHERRRLLYVACTRARDHLVVSVHRKTRASGRRTLAELVAGCGLGLGLPGVVEPEAWAARSTSAPSAPEPHGSDGGHEAPPVDLTRWRADHDALLAGAGRARTIAATSLGGHDSHDPHAGDDPGLAKGPVDLDAPPWHKGRYGTAIGRAVHAVLQTVDLATGDGLEAASAAQAAAEGVLGREGTIAALARSALRSRVVHEALAVEHWREVFVATPVGDTLLEGYVDLLFRDDDGLVVVDYKTDQPRDDADLADRAVRYRLQLAAYALAVERVTGEAVSPGGPGVLLPDGWSVRSGAGGSGSRGGEGRRGATARRSVRRNAPTPARLNSTSTVRMPSAISVGSRNDQAISHDLPLKPEKMLVSTSVPFGFFVYTWSRWLHGSSFSTPRGGRTFDW